MKPGERVGVILKAKKGVIEFLGWGTYVGNEIPYKARGLIAKVLRKLKRKSPKIELDSGEVVYGCECWWGSEERVKEVLKKAREVKEVDISRLRGHGE